MGHNVMIRPEHFDHIEQQVGQQIRQKVACHDGDHNLQHNGNDRCDDADMGNLIGFLSSRQVSCTVGKEIRQDVLGQEHQIVHPKVGNGFLNLDQIQKGQKAETHNRYHNNNDNIEFSVQRQQGLSFFMILFSDGLIEEIRNSRKNAHFCKGEQQNHIAKQTVHTQQSIAEIDNENVAG